LAGPKGQRASKSRVPGLYLAAFAEGVLDWLEAVPVCAHPQNSTDKRANAVGKIRFMGSSVLEVCVVHCLDLPRLAEVKMTSTQKPMAILFRNECLVGRSTVEALDRTAKADRIRCRKGYTLDFQ
jgi:hypothetical protein